MANNEKFVLCSSEGTPQYEASSWNVISQASPTAVSLNPATLTAFSNANGFDSVSNGTKSLAFFSNPLPAGTFLFMPWDQAGFLQVEVDGAVSVSSGTNNAFAVLRVRPIIAAWAPPSVSWANFFAAGPTHAADITQSMVYGSQNDSTDATTINTGAGGIMLPPIRVTSAVPIFGLTIDCRVGNETNFASVANRTAQLSAAVPTGASGGRHIYALKMGS